MTPYVYLSVVYMLVISIGAPYKKYVPFFFALVILVTSYKTNFFANPLPCK